MLKTLVRVIDGSKVSDKSRSYSKISHLFPSIFTLMNLLKSGSADDVSG